jgi:outer membrane murein-binding lipoprotein Lpp
MAGNVRRSLVKKTHTVTPGGGHASAAPGAHGGASSSGAAIVSLFLFIFLAKALSNCFCSELQALNSKVSKLSQDVGQIATKVTALEQEQAALRGLVQP